MRSNYRNVPNILEITSRSSNRVPVKKQGYSLKTKRNITWQPNWLRKWEVGPKEQAECTSTSYKICFTFLNFWKIPWHFLKAYRQCDFVSYEVICVCLYVHVELTLTPWHLHYSEIIQMWWQTVVTLGGFHPSLLGHFLSIGTCGQLAVSVFSFDLLSPGSLMSAGFRALPLLCCTNTTVILGHAELSNQGDKESLLNKYLLNG